MTQEIGTTDGKKSDRRRMLAILGGGGAAAVAALLGRREGAEAAHGGGVDPDALHVGEENTAPAGAQTALHTSVSEGGGLRVENPDGAAIHGVGLEGVHGDGDTNPGVFGASNTSAGVQGESQNEVGVRGHGGAGGVHGISASGVGVRGESEDHIGVHGHSVNHFGVQGESDNSAGVRGGSVDQAGVIGDSQNGPGVRGTSQNGAGVVGHGGIVPAPGGPGFGGAPGVLGVGSIDVDPPPGVVFGSGTGVEGESESGYAVRGYSPSGVGVHGEGGESGIGIVGSSHGDVPAVRAFSGAYSPAPWPVEGAESPDGGIALDVVGRARFSTAGTGSVLEGANSVFVANGAVQADSHVSLTPTSDPGERQIKWVEVVAGGFIVHMTSAPPPKQTAVNFTYLVMEPLPA